jgi:hypothetical protein
MRDIAVSKAIITSLEERLGCSDLFDWVESQAESLSALGNGSSTQRTRLSQAVFAARSIIGVELDAGLRQNACIVPAKGGFKILYTQGLPRARRRFAIAHELGHTLFFRAPGSTKALSGLQSGEDSTIEALCDFFARAFLLPKRCFSRRIDTLDRASRDERIPPLHLVPILADEFDVAPQAVARRMVFDIFGSCEVVFCAKRTAGRTAAPWYAVWYAAGVDSLGRMPTGWRIPLDRNGKALPSELIPSSPKGETTRALIDGRLFAAASPQHPTESRQHISRKSALPPKSAFVARHFAEQDLFKKPTELAYLAFPREM